MCGCLRFETPPPAGGKWEDEAASPKEGAWPTLISHISMECDETGVSQRADPLNIKNKIKQNKIPSTKNI